MQIDFKDFLTYGSYIVSLTVAYFSIVNRVVKIETEIGYLKEIREELKEMRKEIHEIMRHKGDHSA